VLADGFREGRASADARAMLGQCFQCCQPSVRCATLLRHDFCRSCCSDEPPMQLCLRPHASDVGDPPTVRAGSVHELHPELKSPVRVELEVHRQPRCEAAAWTWHPQRQLRQRHL
jgi:hypothetical protein